MLFCLAPKENVWYTEKTDSTILSGYGARHAVRFLRFKNPLSVSCGFYTIEPCAACFKRFRRTRRCPVSSFFGRGDAALLLAPLPSALPEKSCFRVVKLTDAHGRDRYPDLLTDSAFPDRVLSYVAGNEETIALYDRLSSHFPPERLQVYLCPEDEEILRRILAEAKACASLPAAATPVLDEAEQALLSELCERFYASDAMAEELERLLCYLHFRCADPAGAVSDFLKDRPPVRNRKEGKACLASFREYCSLT